MTPKRFLAVAHVYLPLRLNLWANFSRNAGYCSEQKLSPLELVKVSKATESDQAHCNIHFLCKHIKFP